MKAMVIMKNNNVYVVDNFEGDVSDVVYTMNSVPFVKIGNHIVSAHDIECVEFKED